jgi:hypothetical protein
MSFFEQISLKNNFNASLNTNMWQVYTRPTSASDFYFLKLVLNSGFYDGSKKVYEIPPQSPLHGRWQALCLWYLTLKSFQYYRWLQSGKNYNNSRASGAVKGEKVDMGSTITPVKVRVHRMILCHSILFIH